VVHILRDVVEGAIVMQPQGRKTDASGFLVLLAIVGIFGPED